MIKLCECGCRQPTKIRKRTFNKRGIIKGDYNRFIVGHQFRGKNHPFYGKHRSKETREKLSKIAIAQGRRPISKGYHSEETREKMRGANAWNWKGGVTSLEKTIRKLPEYKQWRSDIFQRDSWTCKTCNRHRKVGDRVSLIVHHIKSFSELRIEFLKEYDQFSPFEDVDTLIRLAIKWQPFWDTNNGITLCKECHKLTKNYGINLQSFKKGI